MATTAASDPMSQQTDNNRATLLGLPVELRERIYEFYFSLPDGLTVHLINDRPKRDRHGLWDIDDEGYVSSVYHHHLENDTPEYDSVTDIRYKVPDAGLRTSLLRTCQKIHAEANRFTDQMNHFRILGGFQDHEAYHNNFSFIGLTAVLSEIKHLELGSDVVTPSFNPGWPQGWSRGFWNTIVMCMVNLHELTITDQSSCEIYEILSLFKVSSRRFLGIKPEIYVEVTDTLRHSPSCGSGDCKVYLGWGPCDCHQEFYDRVDDRQRPRFVIPPLEKITIRGSMVRTFRQQWDSIEGLKQVKFKKLFEDDDEQGTYHYKYEYRERLHLTDHDRIGASVAKQVERI